MSLSLRHLPMALPFLIGMKSQLCPKPFLEPSVYSQKVFFGCSKQGQAGPNRARSTMTVQYHHARSNVTVLYKHTRSTSTKINWQLSYEPYHTEFNSWRVDYVCLINCTKKRKRLLTGVLLSITP